MIEIKHVFYETEGHKLLCDVSLRAEQGNVLAVIGPNGAGKSTLLRIMSGELTPASGNVLMAGRRLATWSLRERARSRAMTVSGSDLTLPCTSGSIVLRGRACHRDGQATPDDIAIARLALCATDTLRFEDRDYNTLSGGERQRLHLARALAQVWEGERRRALLLEEPVLGLDPSHQHAFMRQARRMADEGCTVVCVLHDLNVACQYADTIAVLQDGQMWAHGTPWAVMTERLLADVFELDALVIAHPECERPVIIPRGTGRLAHRDATQVAGVLHEA